MKVEGFEDLEIWQLSRELSKLVYQFTGKDEFKKDFRFKAQINASSGSIMDNIAEGLGRGGNKEFINFLIIAKGSAEETKSQLYRAADFKYINEEEFTHAMNLARTVAKKITSLINYLKSSEYKGSRYNSSKEPESLYSSTEFQLTENTEPKTENSEQ